jgi:hypothetical protein
VTYEKPCLAAGCDRARCCQCGLGHHLTVAGLSVSGVLAAWCAQTRADVDLAVPIAPAFAPWGVPATLAPGLARLVTRLPNLFVWWDIRKRARLGNPCTYPWFATHAVAEGILLGADVERASRDSPPACHSLAVVTNAADRSVNNAATRVARDHWRAQPGVQVRHYEFEARLRLSHDIIGPYQPNARIDHVYPILFDLIDSAP